MEIPVPYNNMQILTLMMKKPFQQKRKTKTIYTATNQRGVVLYN